MIEGDAIHFKAFLTQTTQKLRHCHYLIIIYLIELIGQVMNLIDRALKQTNQCLLKITCNGATSQLPATVGLTEQHVFFYKEFLLLVSYLLYVVDPVPFSTLNNN